MLIHYLAERSFYYLHLSHLYDFDELLSYYAVSGRMDGLADYITGR